MRAELCRFGVAAVLFYGRRSCVACAFPMWNAMAACPGCFAPFCFYGQPHQQQAAFRAQHARPSAMPPAFAPEGAPGMAAGVKVREGNYGPIYVVDHSWRAYCGSPDRLCPA